MQRDRLQAAHETEQAEEAARRERVQNRAAGEAEWWEHAHLTGNQSLDISHCIEDLITDAAIASLSGIQSLLHVCLECVKNFCF
jgi:hypothetical protein